MTTGADAYPSVFSPTPTTPWQDYVAPDFDFGLDLPSASVAPAASRTLLAPAPAGVPAVEKKPQSGYVSLGGGYAAVKLASLGELTPENRGEYTIGRDTGSGEYVVRKTLPGQSSNIRGIDLATGEVTIGPAAAATTATDAAKTDSLFRSPQFMAPVVASALSGMFNLIITERSTKAQLKAQREALDAQFEVAQRQEEASQQEEDRQKAAMREFALRYGGRRSQATGKEG